ncbi:MAG: hypothetical protein J5695_04970 [Bacteroidales bacterium]|nr:hypothetical protein [Bacteroidales bacterium]
MKKFLQRYGAYIVAIVLFVTLALLYCKPVLVGKVIQSPDDVNGVSAIQETVRYYQETGRHILWTGSMFSGMPNYQISGGHFRSDALLSPLKNFFIKGTSNPAWVLIFYFFCFFILMRAFGVDKWLSIAGAVAIALSSYFLVIIGAGHGGKTVSISYMTLVAAGFYLIFRKKYALGAIMVMFFTAISLIVHLQMSYYLMMLIGLFFLAEVWIHVREKRWKDLGVATLVFAVSLAIGVGANGASVLTNIEYTRETIRGGASEVADEQDGKNIGNGLDIGYATNESYGVDETLSLLIPGFKGGASGMPIKEKSHTSRTLKTLGSIVEGDKIPMYWGAQPFTMGNVYVGAIICFLFLLGCLIVKGPYKWALLAATVFSILLSWGHNFMWLTEFFFRYFPLYSKFRAVSSILIVAEIAMPLLGFLALKSIFEGSVSGKRLRVSLLVSAAVTAGICLFFAIAGREVLTFVSPYDETYAEQLSAPVMNAVVSDRADLLTSDSWRSFGFVLAGAVLLWLYSRKKLGRAFTILILGVLITADLWPVDRRYFNDSFFVRPRATQDAFKEKKWETDILADPDPHFRVLNMNSNTFSEARTSYRFESIGGYHAAKLRRYQDLIDRYLSKNNTKVIGMLNAKYFVVSDDAALRNPNASGNAWFVDNLMVMYRPSDELDALEVIDLSKNAVLGKEFIRFASNYNPGVARDAEVHLTSYAPDRLEYDCTNSKPGTIVFSEIYYPYGWKAFIDGNPADHFRADYVLRALNVPAGSHHITFVFDPDSVHIGEAIAITCIVLMFITMLASAALGVRSLIKKRKDAAATD